MTIQQLHNKAIELAEEAFILKFQGKYLEAKEYFKEAYGFEKQAALRARDENIGEPSLSILLKSAAALAFNFDEFRESERIISIALSGEPPIEIAEELRNLLEEVNFNRHLRLHGLELNPSELQIVFAGPGINYGMAPTMNVFSRVDTFEKITTRTLERKLGKPFREKGSVSKEIKHRFTPYMSIPRAASFAFTIRIGQQENQLSIPEFSSSAEVIEEIIESIQLVNNADFESLKGIIKEEVYLKNFISLAKEFAPDGNEINLVGLTIVRDGQEKQVQFTRTRGEINASSYTMDETEGEPTHPPIVVTGRLFAADEDKGQIRLIELDGTKYVVIVPEGLGDIVKKYWGENVNVKGTLIKTKVIKLQDLDPA